MPCAPAASPHLPVIRFRRLLAAVCAVVGLVVPAAGCGSAAPATAGGPERPDLIVAAVPAAGAAGLYIAAQDGYFTAGGLHVKIVPVASGSDALADLIMATGTFPLTVTPVALGRVADLMQQEHALPGSVNTALLAQEMTSR